MTQNFDIKLVAGPESRGARMVDRLELRDFLQEKELSSEKEGAAGAVLLVRLVPRDGDYLEGHEMVQAGYLLAQLARQPDVVAHLDECTLGIVVSQLSRRSDLHVLIERIEACIRTAGFAWDVSTGVGVFPSGSGRSGCAWDAACRDLEGAISSETWEHEVPRETLRAKEAC